MSKTVYLAAPFGEVGSEKRLNAEKAKYILEGLGFQVYCPWKFKVQHAWDYPNSEWGQMVFTADLTALNGSDLVIMLSYGRESTAGTNWEAGYAFGIGKKIIVVEMTNTVMSLMVANGRYASVKGLEGLENYDFENMPMLRTGTEVV